MDRINGAGHLNRLFVAEDSGTNRPPTEITAAWLNGVQEEIINVITQAGLAPQDADLTQLRQAITKMIQAGQRAVIVNNAIFAPAVLGTGKAVYWDSANSRFDLALADGSAKQACVGFADVPNALVYAFGSSVLFAGLTPGARYYLSGTTAGLITDTKPTNSVSIGIAKSATECFVDIDTDAGISASNNNTFSKAQRGAVVALTDAPTVAVDLGLGNNYSLALAGNRTLGTPTNAVPGQSGVIAVTQDATGTRTLAFAANWKFAGGAAPSLTTTANAVDYLCYYVETATRVYASIIKKVM